MFMYSRSGKEIFIGPVGLDDIDPLGGFKHLQLRIIDASGYDEIESFVFRQTAQDMVIVTDNGQIHIAGNIGNHHAYGGAGVQYQDIPRMDQRGGLLGNALFIICISVQFISEIIGRRGKGIVGFGVDKGHSQRLRKGIGGFQRD